MTTRRQPDYSNGVPADPHAEQVVVGCILTGQLPLGSVTASDFQDPRHRFILQQIGALQKASRPIDAATVALELDHYKKLQAAGGAAYISELNGLPEIIHPERYVICIQQKALRRVIIQQADLQAKRALLDTEPVDSLITSGVDFYRGLHAKNGHSREAEPSIPTWPDPLGEDAFHGVAGELVRLIEPHTEADPAALLLQFLIGFGSLIGRGPYMMGDGARHHTNEYVVLVGPTAKGRKGTSWARIAPFLRAVDEHWIDNRLIYGIGSGEALVDMAAEPDHRVLLHEGEFARLLAIVNREATTISQNLRTGWDNGILEIRTRQNKQKTMGAHLSLIGHITSDELLRRLSDTEVGNGFANRFLFACVQRSQLLPHGGGPTPNVTPITQKLKNATYKARQLGDTDVKWDQEAYDLWGQGGVYKELTQGLPGLLGAVTGRAEPHVMRLALLYALLDSAAAVRREHLRAALEVWRYCFDSAKFIWGDALGDPDADRALQAIRDAGADGLSRWDLVRVFSGHKAGTELNRVIRVLTERGLIRTVTTETQGRPETRYFAL
jgi:hypothetical protein